MVEYISQYTALVQSIRGSEGYRNASKNVKKDIEYWLESRDIQEYFIGRIIPKLTLHELLVPTFINSDAVQEKTLLEQQKVMEFLTSKGFGNFIAKLEKKFSNPL